MNILADTNVWCDFFRKGDPHLTELLKTRFLVIHPLVIGELASGNLPTRRQTLKDLRNLPDILPADFQDTLLLLEEHRLYGCGLQWNDLLLLASVLINPGTLLWTKDLRLARAARKLNVEFRNPER